MEKPKRQLDWVFGSKTPTLTHIFFGRGKIASN